MAAGGIVGRGQGSVIACFNTGDVSGGAACIAGIVGDNIVGAKILACYNTGTISTGEIYSCAGICGRNGEAGAASIEACYSTGDVITIGWDKGAICGRTHNGTITGCFYRNGAAEYGIGAVGGDIPENSRTDEQAWPMTVARWPSTEASPAWGTGNGGENQYWKILGSFDAENPQYPKLWFE